MQWATVLAFVAVVLATPLQVNVERQDFVSLELPSILASNPISLAASAFTATYSDQTQTLKISADGTIPGFWLGPFLQRETLMGGIMFSLQGFPGGLGAQKEQTVHLSIEEHIALPQPHFNSDTVLIKTADGTWSIPIAYIDIPAPAPDNNKVILTPAPLPLGA